MKILIDKAGFVNKGAELMFCSVVEKLKEQYPKAQILAPYDVFDRAGNNYCVENDIRKVKFSTLSRFELIFYKLCVKLKLMSSISSRLFVHSSQVDVIIDAGGFQFGDQWKSNAKTFFSKKRYYSSFNRRCKFILLPQSFGPFENKYSRKTIIEVLKRVGLAYPREEISMNYFEKVAPKSVKTVFKRDFTILHKYDTYIAELLPKGEYVVVIPNMKMITHSSFSDGEYLKFMCDVVKSLNDKGERIFLLNHEGIGDFRICQLINKTLGLNIPIMSNQSAMEVKNVIGNAKLVISSRFHGVVSGITQKVPTFCTSWSHKYNELLTVYGLDNNLLDINSSETSIKNISDALINPEKYITKDEILNREKKSIEDMWCEIFDYINS